jgi:hypothetical protein
LVEDRIPQPAVEGIAMDAGLLGRRRHFAGGEERVDGFALLGGKRARCRIVRHGVGLCGMVSDFEDGRRGYR